MNRNNRNVVLISFLLSFGSLKVHAADFKMVKPEVQADTLISPDEKYFSNMVLIDQHGNTKHLFTDLMKDKVVIINSFFTECKRDCPVMNRNLQEIQDYLGDKMGKSVNIISLTADYKTDQPDILKPYAETYKAKKGWYFVTGEKANIELALKKLGINVESREQHNAIFLVGNVKTGLWKKVNGLAPVEEIIKVIYTVVNDRVQ